MSSLVYVILDIGSRYIKAGPAGLELPYVCVMNKDYPITTQLPSFLELNDTSMDLSQYGEIMLHLDDSIIQLQNAYLLQLVNWMNTLDELSLHNNLREVFKLLLLSMSMCRVIVLDNGLSQINKYLISKILLLNMGVKSTQFVPENILSVISSNSANGLVVSMSWTSVQVSSVVDYRIVNELEDKDGLTGENLHFRIIEQLIEDDHPVLADNRCFEIVQMFVLNHVFCGDESIDTKVVIEGYQFRQDLRNLIINTLVPKVVSMIMKTINMTNVDVKPLLYQNIIFDGGLSNVRGLKSEILKSLRLQSLQVNAIKCLGAWQGASIYFSTSIIKRSRSTRKAQEITKELIRDITKGPSIQLSKLPENIGHFKYII